MSPRGSVREALSETTPRSLLASRTVCLEETTRAQRARWDPVCTLRRPHEAVVPRGATPNLGWRASSTIEASIAPASCLRHYLATAPRAWLHRSLSPRPAV